MAAPWDPFLDCRSEAALTAAGCSAARRCAAHDRARGTIVPANDDEAKDLFYDWIGAWCDGSPLWDFAPEIRERVLEASWAAYKAAMSEVA